MEAQIGLDAGRIGLARLDHRLERRLDLLEIGRRRPDRRERGRFRLDHLADLEQLGEELHRLHGAVAPAQHLAVEQVPAHRRQRADAGAGL